MNNLNVLDELSLKRLSYERTGDAMHLLRLYERYGDEAVYKAIYNLSHRGQPVVRMDRGNVIQQHNDKMMELLLNGGKVSIMG